MRAKEVRIRGPSSGSAAMSSNPEGRVKSSAAMNSVAAMGCSVLLALTVPSLIDAVRLVPGEWVRQGAVVC